MLLNEALRMMGIDAPDWRVHFERFQLGLWIPGFFPAAEEGPLRSEAEAEAMATMFRERTGNQYRNIRAERDPAAPLRAEADWHPNEEEEEELVERAANRFRAQCKDEGVSEVDAEQAIATFRAMMREMAETRAEEDRLEAEAN